MKIINKLKIFRKKQAKPLSQDEIKDIYKNIYITKNKKTYQELEQENQEQKNLLYNITYKINQEKNINLNQISEQYKKYCSTYYNSQSYKAIIPYNNTDNQHDYKQNDSIDPNFYLLGVENIGFDPAFLTNNKNSFGLQRLRTFIHYSLKEGCVFPSMLGEQLLNWCYSQYPMIDKIITYHIYRAFGNIQLKLINTEEFFYKIKTDITDLEGLTQQEIDQKTQDFLYKYQKKLKQLNHKIISILTICEKYGGGYLILNNLDIIFYTKFELQQHTNGMYIFKDNKSFPEDSVMSILSTMIPETTFDRQILKNWGFAWLDKYFLDFCVFLKSKAVYDELLSKLNLLFVTKSLNSNSIEVGSEHYETTSPFSFGESLQNLTDAISDMSNNSVLALKPNYDVKNLTINGQILKDIFETRIKELASNFSIPLEYFIDVYDKNSYFIHKQTFSNVSDSVEQKTNQVLLHYLPTIEKIIYKFILNLNNLEQNYTKIFNKTATVQEILEHIDIVPMAIDNILSKKDEINIKLQDAEANMLNETAQEKHINIQSDISSLNNTKTKPLKSKANKNQ